MRRTAHQSRQGVSEQRSQRWRQRARWQQAASLGRRCRRSLLLETVRFTASSRPHLVHAGPARRQGLRHGISVARLHSVRCPPPTATFSIFALTFSDPALRFDNPASVSSFPGRHLTYHYLAALNSWLLTFPSSLCCDWTMGTVALVDCFFDPRNLATLAFYIVAGRIVWSAFIQGDPTVVMVRPTIRL